MDVRRLKIFITVYEELSMTNAANKLFMTQPTVSQAIKEVENYYGTTLFERLSKKLYATESGKYLYEYATHVVKLLKGAEDTLRENAPNKKLTIGANYTVGVALIHKYIEKFKLLYPNLEIRVNINKSSDLLEMIRKNKLDFALIEEIKGTPDLIEDIFYNDRIIVTAHKKHHIFLKEDITLKDIADEHLLLREKGCGVRNLFEMTMNENKLYFEAYWESTSTTALINAAEKGIGIAVLPYELVKEKISLGSLKEIIINDADFTRKLAVVYHKNKLLTNPIKDFIKICRDA